MNELTFLLVNSFTGNMRDSTSFGYALRAYCSETSFGVRMTCVGALAERLRGLINTLRAYGSTVSQSVGCVLNRKSLNDS